MSKILKNTTASPVELTDLGITIPGLSSITVSPNTYADLAASADIVTSINSGAVILNDGVRDLSAGDSLKYASYTHKAFNVRFLNDPDRVNGFVSRTVQEAIEEAGDRYKSAEILMSRFQNNSNSGPGKWLYSSWFFDSLARPESHPENVKLVRARAILNAAATVSIGIYSTPRTSPTLLATLAFTDEAEKTFVLDINIDAFVEYGVKVISGSCNNPDLRLEAIHR